MLMFIIENQNGIGFWNGDKLYYWRRKIVVNFTNDEDFGTTNGYVLGESKRKWLAKTKIDVNLLVTPPKFKFKKDHRNLDTYCWKFIESDSHKGYKFYVQEWYPVQMIISKHNDYMYLMY